jgi:hypothetical protein
MTGQTKWVLPLAETKAVSDMEPFYLFSAVLRDRGSIKVACIRPKIEGILDPFNNKRLALSQGSSEVREIAASYPKTSFFSTHYFSHPYLTSGFRTGARID